MKVKPEENPGELGRDVLTARGHDVSTVAMQGMRGSNDAVLYEVCRSEGRLLISLDRDFGEVLRFPPEDTAGIAVLDCHGRLSPRTILSRVKGLAALLDIQDITGQLWIVEPGRVRVHERRDRR